MVAVGAESVGWAGLSLHGEGSRGRWGVPRGRLMVWPVVAQDPGGQTRNQQQVWGNQRRRRLDLGASLSKSDLTEQGKVSKPEKWKGAEVEPAAQRGLGHGCAWLHANLPGAELGTPKN